MTDEHDAQTVLLVALCAGQRCDSLRRLAGPTDGHMLLRRAVRERSDGVLLHTACQGLCHRGSVALVGRALSTVDQLSWTAVPVVVGTLDCADRLRALAEWVRVSAPAAAPPNLLRDLA